MAVIKNQSFLFFPTLFLVLMMTITVQPLARPFSSSSFRNGGGSWVLLHKSIGISAMHMQVLKNNKVIMFDRLNFGKSNISLPDGKCNYNDEVVKPKDCTAHSVLYDIATNTLRPLFLETDTWCSSGAVNPAGTLIQTGGDRNGERKIRTFTPCDDDSCDWVQLTAPTLLNRRWYATNQILPDGRVIIVGGRNVFSYEFYPKNPSQKDNVFFPFLLKTTDYGQENNLYPFLHLMPDGNLFIFANNRSILLDYNKNVVIKEYPEIPGSDRRNYPSTGSSVLLPLLLSETVIEGTDSNLLPEAEVMICGGAPHGAFLLSNFAKVFVEASWTCGRLKVFDPNPKWVMESMPIPRVMGDMLLLPSGDVLLINGATNGTAGWENAVNPVYNPVLYKPEGDPNSRFRVLNPSKIARMYHSTAALLPDGRVLVGGSNPHTYYEFTRYPYPTEISLEAFYPPYLHPTKANLRPSILTVESNEGRVSYNEVFSVTFGVNIYIPGAGLSVVLTTPSFNTHSFSMNQRMLVLGSVSTEQLSMFDYKVSVIGPTNGNVAPPGYYMLFVVHAGVPSEAVWVKVQ